MRRATPADAQALAARFEAMFRRPFREEEIADRLSHGVPVLDGERYCRIEEVKDRRERLEALVPVLRGPCTQIAELYGVDHEDALRAAALGCQEAMREWPQLAERPLFGFVDAEARGKYRAVMLRGLQALGQPAAMFIDVEQNVPGRWIVGMQRMSLIPDVVEAALGD